MRPTRVFLLYEHLLFARGLERLLQGVTHLEVLGSAAWDEVEALPEGAVEADVLILEKSRDTPDAGVAVSRLLGSRAQARVIRLSLEDNQITVYSAQSLTATQEADLIRALRHDTKAQRSTTEEAG